MTLKQAYEQARKDIAKHVPDVDKAEKLLKELDELKELADAEMIEFTPVEVSAIVSLAGPKTLIEAFEEKLDEARARRQWGNCAYLNGILIKLRELDKQLEAKK